MFFVVQKYLLYTYGGTGEQVTGYDGEGVARAPK